MVNDDFPLGGENFGVVGVPSMADSFGASGLDDISMCFVL